MISEFLHPHFDPVFTAGLIPMKQSEYSLCWYPFIPVHTVHSGWRGIWTGTFTLLYYPMSTALKGLKLLRVCDVQKPGWWVRFSACQQSKSTKMSCCIISFFSLVRIEKIYNRFNKFVQGKTFWQDNTFPLFERMDVLLTKTT